MPLPLSPALGSTLLLTLLLAIGLVFFLRAASKDRTTVVDVQSPRPALEVLDGLSQWLRQRGWQAEAGDPERRVLRFRGQVGASGTLALLLSLLGTVGAACLGLVLRQLLPALGWWPLLLALLGPLAGLIYRRRAARQELVELRLISDDDYINWLTRKQRNAKMYGANHGKQVRALTGLMRCTECLHKMKYIGGRSIASLRCSGDGCSQHYRGVREEDVVEWAIKEIAAQAAEWLASQVGWKAPPVSASTTSRFSQPRGPFMRSRTSFPSPGL